MLGSKKISRKESENIEISFLFHQKVGIETLGFVRKKRFSRGNLEKNIFPEENSIKPILKPFPE